MVTIQPNAFQLVRMPRRSCAMSLSLLIAHHLGTQSGNPALLRDFSSFAKELKSRKSAGFPLCVPRWWAMRRDNDIAQERRGIRTSWNAFGWIVTMFGLIALAGWLLAQ